MTPADPPADPPADRPPDPDGLDREPTDDELAVHAVLDGEATAAQRRRVAGDPGLRAQVTRMKAVVDQVAAPPQAPDDDVFEAIRAAAATHLGEPEVVLDLRDDADPPPAADPDEPDDPDEPIEPGDAPGPPERGGSGAPVVVPLDRPGRRRRRWPALPAVAAAVLVLVALGIGLIVTAGDDSSSDFTAVGSALGRDDQAGDGAGGASEESAEDRSADAEGEAETASPTTTAAPDATGGQGDEGDGDLAPQASFPDDAALREVLEEVDPATLVLDPGPAGFEEDQRAGNLRRADATDIVRCSSVLEASDPAIGPAQAAIVVEVGGEVVHVLSSPVEAGDSGEAGTLLHALDPVSCVPRFAVQR
jgi:hypothetical protein